MDWCTAKRRLELGNDVVEATCLDAFGRALGVAVHRVADPQHGRTGLAHRRGSAPAGAPRSTWRRSDESASAGPARCSGSERRSGPAAIRASCRADLDAHRVRDATEILDVGAVHRGRPHADPREMGRQVVPALAAVEIARLGLLVEQVQALVRRVDVGCVWCDLLRGRRIVSRKSSESRDRTRRSRGTPSAIGEWPTQSRSQYSG